MLSIPAAAVAAPTVTPKHTMSSSTKPFALRATIAKHFAAIGRVYQAQDGPSASRAPWRPLPPLSKGDYGLWDRRPHIVFHLHVLCVAAAATAVASLLLAISSSPKSSLIAALGPSETNSSKTGRGEKAGLVGGSFSNSNAHGTQHSPSKVQFSVHRNNVVYKV